MSLVFIRHFFCSDALVFNDNNIIKTNFMGIYCSVSGRLLCASSALSMKKSTTSVALQPPVTGLHHLVVASGCFRRSWERISRSISPRKCFQKQGKAHMLKLAALRSSLGAVVINLCLFCIGKDLLCHLLCGPCMYLNKNKIFFS